MEPRAQFKSGLYTASYSLSLLTRHKKLLLFFGIPLLARMIFITITYNMLISSLATPNDLSLELHTLINSVTTLPAFVRYFGIFFLTLCALTTVAFFSVALVHHILAILENEETPLRASFSHAWQKFMLIVEWSTFATVIVLYLQMMNAYTQRHFFIASIIPLMLIGLWSLATFYILPVISTQKTSIFTAIKTSYYAVKETFFALLGGQVFIGLMVLLAYVPFIIIDLSVNLAENHPLLFLMVHTIITVFGRIFATINIIFKTVMYYQHKQPEVELAQLRYPRF